MTGSKAAAPAAPLRCALSVGNVAHWPVLPSGNALAVPAASEPSSVKVNVAPAMVCSRTSLPDAPLTAAVRYTR